jgi:hypothetical protein
MVLEAEAAGETAGCRGKQAELARRYYPPRSGREIDEIWLRLDKFPEEIRDGSRSGVVLAGGSGLKFLGVE